MISPTELARQKYNEWQARRQADKEALQKARANAEADARQRWAHQKAKQEADNRYGIGKNKPKGFFASVFPKYQKPRKRSRQDRDYQPRQGGPGITSIPDIDWGLGGGGRKNRRRGGVDLGF